ncbi:fatty acyl-AMP ligase [Streptomyces tailanensis]|uniref:fatty acyl-AMP ligase n=1 Tax=Streptomyces tailanensis TaxID=2569858 RepID=UPI00122DF6EE|nr:fatty acyl-AMP ligase [Streptomyces tailanensis]
MTEPCTMSDVLAGLDSPGRGLTFLDSGPEPLSFAELARTTEDLARRWAGLGVRPGDRVVLAATDIREFALTLLSAMRAGVVPAPAFPPLAFGKGSEQVRALARICRAAGAEVCLVGDHSVAALQDAGLSCRVGTFQELAAAVPGPPPPAPGPDDPALLQFTSGSTADPKGVLVTQRALAAHTRALATALEIDCERDRGVSWLPLYHDMGLIGKLLVAVVTQTSTWYMSPLHFLRDPVGFLRLLSEVRGTISYAPNFAYGLLTRRVRDGVPGDLDLSAWRIAGCGAEPVRAQTLRRFAEVFEPAGFRAEALFPCYGLAEATLAVCAATPGKGMTTLTVDADRLAGQAVAQPTPPGTARTLELVSNGRPLPGTSVDVVDVEGRRVPEGMVGEIVVSGRHLASGYHEDPELTARTWRDGRLHTGDTGFLHDGELYVTGRIQDLIIVNGRNHQPHDIERVAEQVDGVRPGNVIALAVDQGDSSAVRIVLEPRSFPAAPDLPRRVTLAVQRGLGVPVADVIVIPKGALPKTSSGKPRRRHTAHLLESGELAPSV